MAGKITRFIVRLEGINKIKKNLDKAVLMAPALHDAMSDIGSMSLAAAKSAAPRGPSFTNHVGGATAGKLGTRMQSRPLPLWVKVETTAVRPWAGHGNYSYPKRVEWDVKLHHQGWLRNAIGALKGRFAGVLQSAGQAMESVWTS